MNPETRLNKLCIVTGLFFILTNCRILLAEDIKWEFGLGIAGISIPHYLGSDEELNLSLPLPYGSYEDKKTQIDRDGFNYNLFGIKDLDLSFSVALGLPVNSDDNTAREGMKDLETLVEVGPAVKYWLIKSTNDEFSIVFPLRSAFAVDDFSISQEGITGSVELNYTKKFKDWEINGIYSFNYGDRKYHSQFYDVDQRFVNPDRNYYKASKGISSQSFSVYLNKRWDKFYFGLYARAENLENAANINSPLVKQTNNLYASIYFGWVFLSSEY